MKVYFKRQKYCRLKTLRVPFLQTSLIERIFSFHCKNAEIRQSSPFERGLRLPNFTKLIIVGDFQSQEFIQYEKTFLFFLITIFSLFLSVGNNLKWCTPKKCSR